MESFQVDVLLSSLKELQEEKLQKERVLAEEYGKRKQLEAKLEDATTKHSTASQKNTKTREAVKVAERRVSQIQTQVKMFEKLNDEKRQQIAHLNKKIADVEEKGQEQLGEFEERMTAITERFRHAKDYYTEESVDAEITRCEQQKQDLMSRVTANKAKLQELTARLQELQSQLESQSARDTIPTDTWKAVVAMFKEENEAAKAAVERARDKLEAARENHYRLSKEVAEIESKLTTESGSHEE